MNQSLSLRHKCVRLITGTIEVVVLLTVVVAPWGGGAVPPPWEFALEAVVALLLVLWGLRVLLEGQLRWANGPVVWCLAGLFLLGVVQAVPLPPAVLKAISPGTVELNERILPTQPETLPGGVKREAVVPPPGSTLSCSPSETRRELLRFLAVVGLFVIVRNTLVSSESLRRLAIVCVINGTLLSLFGIVHFFTAPPYTIYWVYPVAGQVFGTFGCRNHFPFYVNICIGLGLGLVLSLQHTGRSSKEHSHRARHHSRSSRSSRSQQPQSESREQSWAEMLQDARVLWLGLAIVIMICAVLLSLSRGGVLSLVAGGLVCILMQPSRFIRPGALVLLLAVASVVTWFGLDLVTTRLSTLGDAKSLKESRLELWQRCLVLSQSFPLTGTGYGTFQYIEPFKRQNAADDGFSYEYAHNDYLDALVEGGVVRLALTLILIGSVYWTAWKVLRRAGADPGSDLIMGALFGFTAMVVHSFMDFGIHIPANTFLGTVLVAQLAGLVRLNTESENASSTSEVEQADPLGLGIGVLTAVLAALASVVVAVVLVHEGWGVVVVDQIRYEAGRVQQIKDYQRRLEEAETLAEHKNLARDYADVQVGFGLLYQSIFEDGVGTLDENNLRAEVVDGVFACAIGSAAATGNVSAVLAELPGTLAETVRQEHLLKEKMGLIARAQVPALKHFLRARDLSPIQGQPQLQLAWNARWFQKGDTREAYLARATFLRPADPDVWYGCGINDLREGHQEQALQDWKNSLALSPRHLKSILERARNQFDAREIRENLLPPDPALLLATAEHLYSQPEAQEERTALLQKALALLDRKSANLSAEELHIKGRSLQLLSKLPEALTAFRTALLLKPEDTDWRFEYATILKEQGQLQEAGRELELIQVQNPNFPQAKPLLDQVRRAQAEGKQK